MDFFKIKGMGKGFDGLIVAVSHTEDIGHITIAEISQVFDSNVMFGDRLMNSFVEGMYIDTSYLEQTEDPRAIQFASDNPFGKFIDETHNINVGEPTYELTTVMHERAMQVVLRDMYGKKYADKYVYSSDCDLNVKRKEIIDIFLTDPDSVYFIII